MRKLQKIFYNPIGGSAPLGVYWSQGPYGHAHEAIQGHGVYFLDKNNTLIGALFDDVDSLADEQTLVVDEKRQVKVKTTSGKVKVLLGSKDQNISLKKKFY